MNIQADKSHTIRIALAERRICISMDVLHQIGNPHYIQLFVNRDKNSLFIKGCDKKEPNSFAVPARVYADAEYKYRLTKSAFAEAMGSFCSWDSQGKYRLVGAPYADRVMRFSLAEVERLDNSDEV